MISDGSKVQGVQWFKGSSGSRVQEFKSSRVQEFKKFRVLPLNQVEPLNY
jgi:hypothetical protein